MLLLPHIFLGTLREHYIMLFGAAGLFASTCGFAAAWVGARVGARAGTRRALEDQAHSSILRPDARLDQLTMAVDAIALEVERMAEGQRFTARILSERMPPAIPSPRRDPGTVTPH
jgi:hypothetical protein